MLLAPTYPEQRVLVHHESLLNCEHKVILPAPANPEQQAWLLPYWSYLNPEPHPEANLPAPVHPEQLNTTQNGSSYIWASPKAIFDTAQPEQHSLTYHESLLSFLSCFTGAIMCSPSSPFLQSSTCSAPQFQPVSPPEYSLKDRETLNILQWNSYQIQDKICGILQLPPQSQHWHLLHQGIKAQYKCFRPLKIRSHPVHSWFYNLLAW